jgi:hypothetical protein
MSSRSRIAVIQRMLQRAVAAGVVGLLAVLLGVVLCGARAAFAHAEPGAADAPTVTEEHAPAAGEPAKEELLNPEAVIPPGQEELLADMLGRGATLPGECKFAGVEADHAVVRTTYSCPSGEVVFELRHPSEAPRGATQTERFAITVKSGNPPNGLAEALASLIRSRESKFVWKWVGPTGRTSTRPIGSLAAGVLVVAVGLWWMLRRRRRSAA